jgi:hypothetical protein
MSAEITRRDRVRLGAAGLGCAVLFVAIFAYAGPYLRWAAGVVDRFIALF